MPALRDRSYTAAAAGPGPRSLPLVAAGTSITAGRPHWWGFPPGQPMAAGGVAARTAEGVNSARGCADPRGPGRQLRAPPHPPALRCPPRASSPFAPCPLPALRRTPISARARTGVRCGTRSSRCSEGWRGLSLPQVTVNWSIPAVFACPHLSTRLRKSMAEFAASAVGCGCK